MPLGLLAALVSDRPLWASRRASVKAEHAARARCALLRGDRVRAQCRVSTSAGGLPRDRSDVGGVGFFVVCCPPRACMCDSGRSSYVSRALNGADLARLGGSEAPRRASSWATVSRGRAPKRERARSRPASLPHCPCVMWHPWRRSFAEALARCCRRRRFRCGAPMRTASGTHSHEVSARAREVYFQGSPN